MRCQAFEPKLANKAILQHSRDGLFSVIKVSVHRPRKSAHLTVKEILAFEFEHDQDLKQVITEHKIEVGGFSGNQAEYTWSIGYMEARPGRSIVTTVVRDEEIYVLHLNAADDRFDDFRPVYDQLIETFQFLDS